MSVCTTVVSTRSFLPSSSPRSTAACTTRSLTALSALVAHLTRTLLTRTLFGGSLARMFHEIAPTDPGPVAGLTDVLDKLWLGVERVVFQQSVTKPYVGDL